MEDLVLSFFLTYPCRMAQVTTRTYKERSQPEKRAKFGLLEKHKDYVARARDFNKKKRRLKALSEKALNRNPDEFYFGMIKGKTVKGVHKQEREETKYSSAVLSLMKSQDLSYVQMQKRKEEAKLQKEMQESVCAGEGRGRKVLFVRDLKEAKQKASQQCVSQEKGSQEEKKSIIEQRRERLKALQIAEREMKLKRNLQAKGTKFKVGEDQDGVPVFKWKNIRQK